MNFQDFPDFYRNLMIFCIFLPMKIYSIWPMIILVGSIVCQLHGQDADDISGTSQQETGTMVSDAAWSFSDIPGSYNSNDLSLQATASVTTPLETGLFGDVEIRADPSATAQTTELTLHIPNVAYYTMGIDRADRLFQINYGGTVGWEKQNSKIHFIMTDTGTFGLGTKTPQGRLDIKDGDDNLVIKNFYNDKMGIQTYINGRADVADYHPDTTQLHLQPLGGSVIIGHPGSIFGINDKLSVIGNMELRASPSARFRFHIPGQYYYSMGIDSANGGNFFRINYGGKIEGWHFAMGSTGNIGIGVQPGSHELTVNGQIRAKEIIVDTGWADYVFVDDYRLPSLSEVEEHIREHGHLPGVPSVSTVSAEGVSLGEMQSALLAKIEELTLHLIAQDKNWPNKIDNWKSSPPGLNVWKLKTPF
jgi:hypothetical protein